MSKRKAKKVIGMKVKLISVAVKNTIWKKIHGE